MDLEELVLSDPISGFDFNSDATTSNQIGLLMLYFEEVKVGPRNC